MNAKILLYLAFIVYYITIQDVSATIKTVKVATEDKDKKCLATLDTCTLKLNDIDIHRGEKGDKGESGFKGLPGPKGDKGNDGNQGPEGRQGLKGDKGNMGSSGLVGLSGIKGDKGDKGTKGEKGDRGESGLTGSKGEKGFPGLEGAKGTAGINLQGPPGPKGPRGLEGLPNLCYCRKLLQQDMPPDETETDPDAADDWGTKDSPKESTCKNAPVVQDRIYHLGPPGSPFKVRCYEKLTAIETCVIVKKKTTTPETISRKEKFWLSEVGVNIKEIYGLTVEQIMWLQEQSSYVRQTLKYNCLNSVPYLKTDFDKSVKLLTWNDNVIGPVSSQEYPYFYSVPSKTDMCTNGSTDWQSTIIELQSSNVTYRLPIIDLLISYPHSAKQKMIIENEELCFGSYIDEI